MIAGESPRRRHGTGGAAGCVNNNFVTADMNADGYNNHASVNRKRLGRNRHWSQALLLITFFATITTVGMFWMLTTRIETYPPNGPSKQSVRRVPNLEEQDRDSGQRAIALPPPDITVRLETANNGDGEVNLHGHAEQDISARIHFKHPQSTVLQSWNYSVVFRPFPSAKLGLLPIKISDTEYPASYAYFRNESKSASKNLGDHDDYLSPGGFDRNSSDLIALMQEVSKGQPISQVDKIHLKEGDPRLGEHRLSYDDDMINPTDDGDLSLSAHGTCRAADWDHAYYPTCNSFHEIDIGRPFDVPSQVIKPRHGNSMKVTYLSHGYYRDVYVIEEESWLWPSHFNNESNQPNLEQAGVGVDEVVANRIAKSYRSVALKVYRYERDMHNGNRGMINVEAVIMERLSKSPRIMNIYGHCGLSVSTEVLPIEFEESVVFFQEGMATKEEVGERNKDGLRPYNNYTAEEKLDIVLSMAESIADLHGFEDGVIVHDDIQLCQWLKLPDGRLKLGDFNRGVVMQYDVQNEKYCKFNNGESFGNYRSPEEFAARDLNEKIDVFSFGNNIYALLNGLWGFHDIDDDETTQQNFIDGHLPYIDPRWREEGYIEQRLVELMEKCWIYDPAERVDIFYAVEFLRETVSQNKKTKGLLN